MITVTNGTKIFHAYTSKEIAAAAIALGVAFGAGYARGKTVQRRKTALISYGPIPTE